MDSHNWVQVLGPNYVSHQASTRIFPERKNLHFTLKTLLGVRREYGNLLYKGVPLFPTKSKKPNLSSPRAQQICGLRRTVNCPGKILRTQTETVLGGILAGLRGGMFGG